ncbi:PKD1L2 [Mytilus edulis]|uniref:PKD1L2 n=1 Tax=Mytilus edulis TaxID=6550 RepID=A0A8S3TU41_MYTED|nr:PKD1L2 [Mytilus edulis]
MFRQKDTIDFFEGLSDSSLTLHSLYQLNTLPGLPASANATFFENLYEWLQDADVSESITYGLIDLLDNFKLVKQIIMDAIELTEIMEIESFLLLKIDDTGKCLLEYLGEIFEGFITINSISWQKMKEQEQYYLHWLEEELFTSGNCHLFNAFNGNANLFVTSQNVLEGMGFLLYVRVEFEQSVSYFIQHVQSIPGNAPSLDLECRLNCMKKTALTSILSLRATCSACTFQQQKGNTFWWNVKNFDLYSKTSSNNSYWQSWMLSELNTNEFVIKANVFNESTGYLIEAFMKLASGAISTSVWVVTTNILPYGGSCEVLDADWGETKVSTDGWNDEGYRSSTDSNFDWKEQLNFRIVQLTSQGKETLLYYGSEESNYIRINPGLEVDDYNVTIKAHIYDIFIDYAECTINVGPILPDYISDDEISVSHYLKSSSDNIEYYWEIGNIKQVALNTEVAATPIKDLTLNATVVDTGPAAWVNIGIETSANGSQIIQTFDELWEMYLNPDYEDDSAQIEIIQQLMNFSNILSNVSESVDGTSTVNLDQVAHSIGTVLDNKNFASNETASNAFNGNLVLLEKLVLLANNETYPKYEDYITTCEASLRVLNNALEAILPKMSVETPSQLDIYSIMSDISSRQEFTEPNDADLTAAERAFIASQNAMKNELDVEIKNDVVRNEVTVLLNSISHLGKILQMLNYRKQMPVYTQSGHINSTEDKKLIGDLIQHGFHHNNVELDFVESTSTSTDEQNIQVTLYDHTPFSWDSESKYITSKTVTVSVGNDNITNAAIPSKIKLQNNDEFLSRKSIQIAIPIDQSEGTSQMLLYKMYWKTPSDNLIFSIMNAVNHLNHTVYVRRKHPPTDDTYDWIKQIDQGDWLTSDQIKITVGGGLYTEPANVYIGVLIYLEALSTNTSLRKRRSLSTTIVEYEITGATTGCRVWDTTNEKWDKSSCTVSSSSTINETVCECFNPPGNSFATTFYVPPNTIDFGSVFNKFDLKNNAAVFATVISLVIIYLLICVWAFRQDRTDHLRWALSYLIDNGPYDEYLYILTVYTGLHRHAGTKSNVNFLIIEGDPKTRKTVSSEIRILDDGTNQDFDVGSIRKFVMSVPRKIKDPSVLRIWHDNSGQGNAASWYLNKIILDDIQTDERYLFICNQWLSLDHDDGCISCCIPVTNSAEKFGFSFLFYEKTRENTVDKHMWLSVAVRPEDSNFTRLERLACCLTLLFLTMISNAMFYGQDTGGRISLGPIEFSLSGIYISFIGALIATPPVFLVAYMYRNSSCRKQGSKKATETQNGKSELPLNLQNDQLNKDLTLNVTDTFLPFWCRYIAWFIVTTAVIVSGFFLILYSMEWGKSKSEQWLLSFFLSFFESMFVVDPLKIIVISVLLSGIFKSHREKYVKYDREKVLFETKRHACTPVTYLLDLFKKNIVPLQSKEIKKMKEERKKRLKSQEMFIELVLYMIFLAVLYCVSFSNRDSTWYNIKQHLNQQLVTPLNVSVGDTTIRYDQVKTTSDLYSWLDQTLIPFLFPQNRDNGYQLNSNERLFVQDEVNFRVGPMRLRQVRAVEEPCKTRLWENLTCYDKYSIYREDDHSYCVGWESPPCVRGQSVYNVTFAAWTFVTSAEIWGLPVNGLHCYYSGGGYIAEFVVNYNISRLVLSDLYKYTWIDRQTRAVFTEFTLYNANDNVFTYVTFLIEFPETGGVITSYSFQPFRPYQHVGSLGLFVFICEVILLIGMVVFAVSKIMYIRRHGKRTFRELWHILDVMITILFFICCIMYIGRWIMINAAMDEFEKNKNKFVNFSHIASWDKLFNVFLAFTISLTTFRIMRILSYNDRINQLGTVLSNAGRDLCGCFIMFFLVYAAFIISGHLLFGRHLETYKNLFVSSTTLVNAIIGKNSINDLFSIEPVIGRIYYFFFVLFLLWILMTMLNATLNVGITSVRNQAVQSQYGFINLLLAFFRETVGSVIPHGKTESKQAKEKDNMRGYKLYKDTPKEIEIIRSITGATNKVTMKETRNRDNKKETVKTKRRKRRIYM